MQYKLSFLLSFVAVLCYNAVFGQELIYKHYTTKNGLPHDITYQLIQDRNGYIWIGTDDGLAKFNGTEFTNYSYEDGLASNYVIDIIENKNGVKYIGTWGGGLHKLENEKIIQLKDSTKVYTKTNKIAFLSNNRIYLNNDIYNFKIYDVQRNKFDAVDVVKTIGTPKGLLINPIKQLKKYNTQETVVDGDLFVHTNPEVRTLDLTFRGIYLLKNKDLVAVNEELLNIEVHAITKHKDTLVVASYNKLLKIYKNSIVAKEVIKGVEADEKLLNIKYVDNVLYFVKLDSDAKREFYAYKKEKTLFNFSEKLKIKSLVSDFLIDQEKNIWITTYGGGVYQILELPFQFYDDSIFDETDFKDIQFNNEKVYILSTNAVYQMYKGKVEKKTMLGFHEEKFVINEKNELEIITLKTEKELISNALDIPVKAIRYYAKNVSKDVVIQIKNFAFKNRIVARKNTPITKYVLKDSVFYVSYARGGFCKFNVKTGELLNSLGQKSKMQTNRVSDFEVIKDTVWLATNKGLFKLVNNEIEKHYTTKNGLLSNHINSVCLNSEDNSLWLGTQKGLNVKKDTFFYALGNEVGQESSFITRVKKYKSGIYAIGNNGLFTYDIHKEIPTNKTNLLVSRLNIGFKIDLINFTNPKSIKIAYKLNNEDWITTKNTILNLSTLPGGTHIVQFKYKDNLSNWKYTKDYIFKKKVPWHEQTWFYVAVTIFILGGIVLLLVWGLRRSIKKNKELKSTIEEKEELQKALKEVRKNVARDFHDELGNKLASISITSNLLTDENYLINKEKHTKKIKQIKKDADYLYQGMRDFVWALDHKNDDVHQLQGYLNDFGESLFENTIIAFYSSHNLTNEKVGLPFYWSKQLVLVFKEAMTNVLKHSKATQVKLNFILDKNTLTIELEDNGIGYTMEELKRVNGIKNMKHRVRTLNQQIKIETEKGVKITFLGNLNEGKNE